MSTTRVQLAAYALFWRLAMVIAIVRQWIFWLAIQWLPATPAQRLWMATFGRHGVRRSFLIGLIAAAVVTMLVDLLVGLIVRPLMRHWHAPRIDLDSGLFHLGANEGVVASSPARRASDWGWPCGLLVLTNRRLWFFPIDHLAEAWSCPLEELSEVRLRPAPPVAWGFLRNWPDRFTLATSEGTREQFAVPDPLAVLSWFKPARAAVRSL
jgi:hypothetical protein